MKKIGSILILVIMISCAGNAQDTSKEKNTYKVVKTDSEWKKLLSPMQYTVLREAGTERAFTSLITARKKELLFVQLVKLLYMNPNINMIQAPDGPLLIEL
jgi:peptide-methionine (R)-S-oxide reductase